MSKVAFVVNSLVSKKELFYEQLAKVRSADIELKTVETSAGHRAIKLAREFADDGYTHIIAVGGDGTLNEVLNGIMLSGKSVHLGILPFGTANDFVKSVATPENIQQLLTSITRHSYRELVVGTISYQLNRASKERYFINIADMGIGAEVVLRVNKSKKRLGSDLTFMKAIIQTFLTYTNKSVKILADDWEWEGRLNSLAIANGKYFGSGLCIAPNANPSTETFEVVISGDISIMDYIRNVSKIKKGKVIIHPQLLYKTAREITVTSDDDCAIECDGEYLGTAPVTVGMEQKKISFIIQS